MNEKDNFVLVCFCPELYSVCWKDPKICLPESLLLYWIWWLNFPAVTSDFWILMLETWNETLLKGIFQKAKSCFSLKISLLIKSIKADMQNQKLIVLEYLGHLANREKLKKILQWHHGLREVCSDTDYRTIHLRHSHLNDEIMLFVIVKQYYQVFEVSWYYVLYGITWTFYSKPLECIKLLWS